MINRDSLYDALLEVVALHGGLQPDEDELRAFTIGMMRAPSGVSLDQAVIAEFQSLVPETIISVQDALKYAATYLKKELVDYWRSSTSQVLVDALNHAIETGSYDSLPEQFVGFVARLESANYP